MKLLKKAALATILSTGILVTGCSSDDNSPVGSAGGGSTSGGSTGSVAGTAVKGILKNALVTAYELDDKGERKPSSVGETRTDNEGNYTLTLNNAYTNGVLDIEVKADNSTLMVCDAASCGKFGHDVKVDGLTLNSVVVKEKGKNATDVPVTAWTSMAASRTKALAKNGNIQTAASQAISEVSQLAGFDVLGTKAKAVTDENLTNLTSEEQQAAIMNAVVAEMVLGTGKKDLATELNNFATAMNSGNLAKGNKLLTSLSTNIQTVQTSLNNSGKTVNASVTSKLNKSKTILNNGFEPIKPVVVPSLKPPVELNEENQNAIVAELSEYKNFTNEVFNVADDYLANLTFLATVRHSLLNNLDNTILADFKEEEGTNYDNKKSDLLDYGLCKFGSYSGSISEGDDKESFKGKMTFNNCEYAFSDSKEKEIVILNGELDYTTNKTNEISTIKNFKVSISKNGVENKG